jgi:non-ribosomal peptide synthetase component F
MLPIMKMPPEQEHLRAKCFHPSGTFVEFPVADVESSIPERFQKIVRMYPDRPAVHMSGCALTYDELNRTANRLARAIIDRHGEGNEPVAILLQHGGPVIPAMLGVLKAGKIFGGEP